MHVENKLKVVLYWHMHQPEYRDLLTGVYQQPWTYLHTIKDYIDMAMHLEAQPQARVIVNFTPILLEQIEDYAKQVVNYLINNPNEGAYLRIGISPEEHIKKNIKSDTDRILSMGWQSSDEVLKASSYPTGISKIPSNLFDNISQHGYETAKVIQLTVEDLSKAKSN